MYVKSPFSNQKTISPAEKRQIARRHLIYYLRVWDVKQDKLLGHLADVSTDGLMTVGETPIELDKDYHLKMVLPSVTGENDPLEFEALSCWSSNDVNEQFYDTGFQFTKISEETVGRIKDIIAEYGFTS